MMSTPPDMTPGPAGVGLNAEYLKVRFLAEEPPGGWPQRFGIVTAYNPMDELTDDAANTAAHKRLVEYVKPLRSFPVTGCSSDLKHREPGLGIEFPGQAEAVACGMKFRQRAVFWIEGDQLWLLPSFPEAEWSPLFLGRWSERLAGLGDSD